MARKVGQIIARGDHRWLVRVYLGRDRETTKRKYHNRTIHGSLREAQAYLTKRLRERDLGRDLEGTRITLNEYLDRWFEVAVKPRVREKTCQDYGGMLRRYIRPNLGGKLLTALRPLDLQTTYQEMTERGLSARTVRYTHAILRSAMRQALNWRLLLESPAEGVKLPQQPRSEMQVLTVEQVRIFLKAARATPHGPALALAVATGMRPSEYLGLKWQDIDWVRRTVRVVRSLRRLNGRWYFGDTKRSRSRRAIKLQNWIVTVLRELHTATTCAPPTRNSCPEATDLVLKTVSGYPINSDRLAKSFKFILGQAGLPKNQTLRSTTYGSHAGLGRRRLTEGGI